MVRGRPGQAELRVGLELTHDSVDLLSWRGAVRYRLRAILEWTGETLMIPIWLLEEKIEEARMKAKIRSALEKGERLTEIKALTRFGIYNLSSIIEELRESGMDIRRRQRRIPGGSTIEYYLYIDLNEEDYTEEELL